MVAKVFLWENVMTSKFLVVLDRAQSSCGPDPFRILRYDPLMREIFALIHYTQGLKTALESVRVDVKNTVLVVGPTFLVEYPEGKVALKALFVRAGLPENRIVIGSNQGLSTLYEHAGITECNVVNVVRRASR